MYDVVVKDVPVKLLMVCVVGGGGGGVSGGVPVSPTTSEEAKFPTPALATKRVALIL